MFRHLVSKKVPIKQNAINSTKSTLGNASSIVNSICDKFDILQCVILLVYVSTVTLNSLCKARAPLATQPS